MTPLLTTSDLMVLLKIKSRTSLYQAIANGTIPPPRKIGAHNRWLPADIEAAAQSLPQGLADTSKPTDASVKRRAA